MGVHLTEECWLRYGPGEIILLFAGSVKMVMMFAPCGDRGRQRHLACLILLCCYFGLDLIYFRYYLCCEGMMVFAPGGDGGCPHQPVSGIVCTTVFFLLCLL